MSDYTTEFLIKKLRIRKDRDDGSAVYDITAVINEVNIYEHIDKPYLTGQILFADNDRIVERTEISGTEVVEIEITTDNGKPEYTIQKRFIITEIVRSVKTNDSTELVGFSLIEDIGYYSRLIKLQKSYNGKPADIIKNNTKTLEMAFESKVAEELIKEAEDIKSADVQEFGLMDLLFVAFVSILSGILIALIYIQLKSRQTKKIDYDFDEAPDTSSSVAGLPKGLSITNNQEEQQLDLAVTYFEMGDLENSKSILDDLIKSSQSDKIKNNAKALLDKFSEK